MRTFSRPALLLALASPVAAQSPLPEPELLRRLESTMDSLVRLDQFSGVVLLTKDGKPVWERAYGFADREAGRRNDVETGFNLGSINKLFTSIAIRQLAAEGKLHLDSTLAKAWPDYPNQDVARRVTIRQMLSHRSGIAGNIFGAPPGKSRHDVRHNNDYFALVRDNPLAFEPGSRQQYSNAGFVVLGMLVERLSGMDYYRYVHERIYAPAGMTRTAAFPVVSLPPNTATGYTGAAGERARNTSSLPGRGSAAGGGYSTAHDLMRFLVALRQQKIAAAPPAGSVGIAGGAPGLNGIMEGDIPGGYDLIVLSNYDPPSAERVGRIIRGWLGVAD